MSIAAPPLEAVAERPHALAVAAVAVGYLAACAWWPFDRLRSLRWRQATFPQRPQLAPSQTLRRHRSQGPARTPAVGRDARRAAVTVTAAPAGLLYRGEPCHAVTTRRTAQPLAAARARIHSGRASGGLASRPAPAATGWCGRCPARRPSSTTAARDAITRSGPARRTWWPGRQTSTDRPSSAGIGTPDAGWAAGAEGRLPGTDEHPQWWLQALNTPAGQLE